MNRKGSQKLLEYCCIMLYDHASFNPHPTDNDSLVELFIRNSLKVKSTKQVRMYFENHLVGKIGNLQLSNQERSQVCLHL